ncbi:MAG: serine/threonine protein kinase [Chlamydiota bacterium]
MTQPWRHLQGQVVGGKFALGKYLGGSDHSAVFLTERPQGEPHKAAVKIVAAQPEKAALHLSRWAEAEKMSHPHLLRLFEMGRCRLGGEDLLFLVMEYAEENLAQVVASRALTSQECQEMLPPVLEALAYMHSQGFIHGHVKPANIMAAEERVKIACDGLVPPGNVGAPGVYDPPESSTQGLSPAGDVWSLGMTLVEVMTQKVPALEAGRREAVLPREVPAALVNVIRKCLCLDPKQRWTVGQITAALAPVPAGPVQQPALRGPQADRGKKNYLASAVAVALLLVIFVAGWIYSRPRKSAPPVAATVETEPPAADEGNPTAEPPGPAANVPSPSRVQGPVVREVLPKVPKSARDTIHGTIRVRVRVVLDPAGNVTGARFESAGPSKYFARLSLQAAQGWKFAPPQPQGPNTVKEWLLRFDFRRDSTHVVPTPVAR